MSVTVKPTPTLAVDVSKQLSDYSQEVKGLLRTTLMSAVRIGEILKDVRDNLLPYGEWLNWVDEEFEQSINRDTATNLINVSDLYNKYADTYPKGLESLSLSALYIISRHTIDSEVQEAILEVAEERAVEGNVPNREEIRSIVQSYRLIKMEEAGLAKEVQQELVDLEVMEDPSELKRLQRLSKKKQGEVATLLSQGTAKTTKEAVKQIAEVKRQEADLQAEVEAPLTVEVTKSVRHRSLDDIPSESIAVALVEAPLKMHFVDRELHELAKDLERVLQPGGYAVITVGHKAAMYAGPEVEPLKALHLLCLRRQPGNSRSIVGTNIMSASVFALFCYKSPYRQPTEMLVDLHTYSEFTDTEAVVGLDEVHNGIERCLERIFSPLTKTGDNLLHYVVSPMHFNISDFMRQTSESLGVNTYYYVKS